MEEDKKITESPAEAQDAKEEIKEPVSTGESQETPEVEQKSAELPLEASDEAAKEEKAPKKEEKEKAEKKWFVIQTYSGQEEQVKEAIERNIEHLEMKDKIFQILVPEEEVVELKGQKRIEKKKKLFPGYVFIEMTLDEATWYTIRQAPGVARFIGTKVKPTPISDREMQRVLKQIGIKKERLEVIFEKGETVRVISGPFRGHTGIVDEINAEKGKIKALINIFGRDTPVEVNFEHAEKII
ncbi:MAG: transcriptional antiterminator NusG [Candidatus Saganbacteria bacterium]|uniref:Transcription termination/antitermination protein NusG n=1 Tax=Candidatus Saganbacteria bacterium TaxID=2575572 RepID=A0A833NS30_UNCSA|nr:MAG: transcriptional antiterminator NusG [Candidatus Saganbacteria bacterium]